MQKKKYLASYVRTSTRNVKPVKEEKFSIAHRVAAAVVKMTLSYVEIGLNTTFALFVVIHVAILVAVFWHIFVIWDEIKTGRILKKDTDNVRVVCLGGASSSGLDFSSISSMQETNSKLISNVNCITPISCL